MRILTIVLLTLMLPILVLGAAYLPGLFFTTDEVAASLGRCSSRVFYSSGGFQDFTDYAKYSFLDPHPEENPYLSKMTYKDIEKFNQYLNDFENWVQVIGRNNSQNELVLNYDFDRSVISHNDYLYIYNPYANNTFDNYNIYFFDQETSTLYYFHNNI